MYDPLKDEATLRADLLGLDASTLPKTVEVPDVKAPDVTTDDQKGLLAAGTQTQAPKAPPQQTPNLPTNTVPDSASQTRAERVNQALYYAGIGKALPEEYFARPSKERQADDKLEMMKQSLLAKYSAAQKKSQDSLEGADKTSQTSINARNFYAATPDGARVKAAMGPMYDLLSANDIQTMGGKKIIEMMGKSSSEEAKTDRTAQQIQGKSDLADKQFGNTQTRDETLHGYKMDENKARDDAAYARALLQADATKERLGDRLYRENNNEARQAIASLPKDAFATMQIGADIDRSINKMGGADKIRGVGIGAGALPNQAVSPEVDKLRRNYNALRNIYIHELYGGNLTEGEAKRGEAAVPAITGLRTVGEVLDGLDIMRNMMNDKVTQATAGWSPDVRETVRKRLAEDNEPLFSPQPRISTKDGGAYAPPPSGQPQAATISAPTPSASPGPHPLNTTVDVKEPAATPQNTQNPKSIVVAGKIFDLQPNGKYLPRK